MISNEEEGDFEERELAAAGGARICTACEHIATSTHGWENYKCRSKENEIDRTLNLVDGFYLVRRKVETCKDARADQSLCGKEGKWYHERKFKIPEKIVGTESRKSSTVTADDL